MGFRLTMVSEYKKKYRNETKKDYKGSVYDYTLSVKYYPKTYFKGNSSADVEAWLFNFHYDDVPFFIPEGDPANAQWEIGKEGIRRILASKYLKNTIEKALKYGFADTEEEVREFLDDALASKTNDDIVRLDWR